MEKITIKPAEPHHADEIHRVMVDVRSQTECKSFFICESPALIKRCLADAGFILIACNQASEIVGYVMIYYPAQGSENLGRYIGLSGEELNRVVHIESTAILPAYRGLGLQLEMQTLVDKLIDKTKYRYILCTVARENIWSRKNLEKSGLKYVSSAEMYGGFQRDILVKVLEST